MATGSAAANATILTINEVTGGSIASSALNGKGMKKILLGRTRYKRDECGWRHAIGAFMPGRTSDPAIDPESSVATTSAHGRQGRSRDRRRPLRSHWRQTHPPAPQPIPPLKQLDRKSTRLNSSQ